MRKVNIVGTLLITVTFILGGCSEANSNSAPFQLSKEEQSVYEKLKKDLNEEHIKDLSPISIAKIYVQSQYDNHHDVQYVLYTDRDDYIHWTYEEDKKIPTKDRGTKEQIVNLYTNIDKGEFIHTSDFEGYIKYPSKDDPNHSFGFMMIKDEDEIWNVSFMPIQ